MRMTDEEYEAARADAAQFAVLPGHEHAFAEVVNRTDPLRPREEPTGRGDIHVRGA
jgi:hypothetical protein